MAKYTYDFPMASLTADIAVIKRNNDNSFEILLVKRKNNPYKDCFALPGGFVDVEKERFVEAAKRELKEETGLEVEDNELVPDRIYEDPNRDPRGRVISMAFAVKTIEGDYRLKSIKAGDDAANLQWVPVDKVLNDCNLAFDHKEIIFNILTDWLIV